MTQPKMPALSMLSRAVLSSLLISSMALIVACQRDPLRIPTIADDGGVVQQDGSSPTFDATTNFDASTDLPPDFFFASDLSGDACRALPEVCNGVDDNCNNQVDEGFDKLNDARYCNNCQGCKQLLTQNAVPGCSAGKCVIKSCLAGYVDANKDVSDGCEYKCTPTGVEICDGFDNDCNNKIDEGLTPPAICRTIGLCAGTTAICKGAAGWTCQYPAGVELLPCTKDEDCGGSNVCDKTSGFCPNVIVVDEELCDGKDGDCDGAIDDPWTSPALATAIGKACDPTRACSVQNPCDTAAGSTCVNGQCSPKKGICADEGAYACRADKQGTECKLTKTGATPGTETCNAKDDNCNGLIDDNVTDNAWITVGSFEIFKYEASRPDADAASAGIASTGVPCSRAGVLPWTAVAQGEAQDACARLGGGARLCLVTHWEQACKGSAATEFPYGATFDATKCNGRAYDPNKDEVLATDKPTTCVSAWGAAGNLLNMSGNVKEWTATSFSGGTPNAYEIKGGAYDTPSLADKGAGLGCSYDLPAPSANLRLPNLGFRCCR